MQEIKASQVFEKDILKPIIDETNEAIARTQAYSKELEKEIKLLERIAAAAGKTAKSYAQIEAANRKQQQTLSEKEKMDKKILDTERRLTEVTEKQRQALANLRLEEQRRNKLARQQAALNSQQVGAFEKLTIKIKMLSDKYRDLIAQEGQETAASRRLREEILALNRVRDNANEALGMHQNRVGQYSQAVSKLTQILGQLGLAFGVFQLIRSSVGVIVDFDTAVGTLGSITQKTNEELKPLTDQALELGATTQYTASEITGLQIELAKLGFTAQEILSSTGGISMFATATGSSIPEAAALAGASLRAFGLEATEMDRVVSVLGVATTKTGLDFEFLNTAMSTVAPVANAFNFSIEDTTALLGQLANSGFDASSAATATRNILLNLADSNGDLAKSLGRPIEGADDLAAGLQELQAKGIDLATALDLTDKRSVAAFETFLKGSDSLVSLRDSITGVESELEGMSARKLDTISGSIDLLKSAWEGLILEWSTGQGVGEQLKDTIKFLADNLKTIINVVLTGLKAFVSYKLGLMLFRKEVDATGRSVAVGLIPSIINTSKALIASIRGFTLSSISIRGFASALKSIPFAGILSFLVTVGPMLWDFAKGLFSSADATSALGEATKEANKQILDEKAKMNTLFEQLKRTNAGSMERKELIDQINSTYGTTLQNLEDETAFTNQLEAAYAKLNKQMETKIRQQVFQDKLTELIRAEIEVQQALEEYNRGATISNDELSDFIDVAGIEGLKDYLKEVEQDKNEIFDAIHRMGLEIRTKGSASGLDPKTREKERAKASGGLAANDPEKIKADKLSEYKKQLANELIEYENNLIKSGADREQIDDLLSTRKIEIARKTGEKIIELDFKDKSLLTHQENEWLKRVEENQIKRIDIIGEADKEIALTGLELAVDKAQKEWELIEETKRKKLEAEAEVWKKMRNNVNDLNSLVEQNLQSNIKALDTQIERQGKIYDESKNREQELIALAKEKSLNADESIKFERERQKAALAEQAKLERKKQQIEALIAFLNAYAAKVQAGEGDPVANIKSDINKAKSFIEGAFYKGTNTTVGDSLGYNGVKDGHIVRIDDDEAILNPILTREMGIGRGRTTKDIADIVKLFDSTANKSMSIKEVKAVAIGGFDSKAVKLLEQLASNTTPSNQQQGRNEFDTITGVLTYQSKIKGRKETIKYKVRK